MGGVSDEVLLARAFLNRLAEPGDVELWSLVRHHGPVNAVAALRSGEVAAALRDTVSARLGSTDAQADLDAAERHGIRLLVPESEEWPHFALACLERTGLALAENPELRDPDLARSGLPVPPLALWARGPYRADALSVRSVGIVGARAATDYGISVARTLAQALASAGFIVVSGGAYGIDAAAHTGALRAGAPTVVVSAGGVDRAYPSGNTTLFDRVASTGLVLSESPPGAAPQRRRFLTRNRLIAALSTGTVLIEAAHRSGALNTTRHCNRLGRPVMAVPGPVTSTMSAGCHQILGREQDRAHLVTSADDVIGVIGSASDVTDSSIDRPTSSARATRLDAVDPASRDVFDGLPVHRSVTVDEAIMLAGRAPAVVLRALPELELAGLVERVGDRFRITSIR